MFTILTSVGRAKEQWVSLTTSASTPPTPSPFQPQPSLSSSALLMPHTSTILNTNLIPKQYLRSSSTLPASITSRGEHESTRRIDVNCTDDTTTMSWDDGERHDTALAGGIMGLGGMEVVDAEDIVGGTYSYLVTNTTIECGIWVLTKQGVFH